MKKTNKTIPVVMITGASRGIGEQTAYFFAKNNYNLAITYHKDSAGTEKVAKKCLKIGANDILFTVLDLRDNESIRKCTKKTISRFGKINILVNNAATISWKKLEDQTNDEIEDQIRTNLEGTIKLTSNLLPYIEESIINIVSKMGKHARKDLVTYCATKYGLRGFTKALAKLKPELSIFSFNPGLTSTRMTGFKGGSPKEVGKSIFDLASGKTKANSGSDIDFWKSSK